MEYKIKVLPRCQFLLLQDQLSPESAASNSWMTIQSTKLSAACSVIGTIALILPACQTGVRSTVLWKSYSRGKLDFSGDCIAGRKQNLLLGQGNI